MTNLSTVCTSQINFYVMPWYGMVEHERTYPNNPFKKVSDDDDDG